MALGSPRFLVLAALVVPSAALAGPAPPLHRIVAGKSVGSPTEGHLIGGARIVEGPHLRIVPAYVAGDARWGLEPLVNLIDHAARSVRKQFPDAMLSVGHLSRAGGGEIDRHASHESGRDADVGFYVRNQQGKPVYADHFVAFKADGTASSWPGAQFDDARNWAFVAAIAGDSRAHVTHIFVALPLRERLLQYAQKIGAPPSIRIRASELMAQPKGALPHDDHFHVRIACPAGMDKCIEQPVARKHTKPHSKAALAHGERHGKPHTHPPGHGAAKAKPERTAPEPRSDDSEKEAFVPSLAPMVPGLDSAVIAAKLASPAKVEKPVKPDEKPIDDPDGVLDRP